MLFCPKPPLRTKRGGGGGAKGLARWWHRAIFLPFHGVGLFFWRKSLKSVIVQRMGRYRMVKRQRMVDCRAGNPSSSTYVTDAWRHWMVDVVRFRCCPFLLWYIFDYQSYMRRSNDNKLVDDKPKAYIEVDSKTTLWAFDLERTW